MSAFLLAVVLAASPKLAVLRVAVGEGVPATTAAPLTEALVAEVRRPSGAEVVTQARAREHPLAREAEGDARSRGRRVHGPADPAGRALVTATGGLVAQSGVLDWGSGETRTALREIDLSDTAPFVYGELGAYEGARLGTHWDGSFR